MNNEAKFVDFATTAADTMGNGFIHVPVFENEILDMTHKRGALLQRINAREATGHPTRYFEKTARMNSAGFVDPRNLSTTYGAPTRVERSAFIKAITSGIKFGFFDMEVAGINGQFNLKADDLKDLVEDVLTIQDNKVWTGSDTSLTAPTTLEYMGLLKQITQTGTISASTKISTAIRSEVARLAANTAYDVKPSAIYMNPLTIDIMEQEEEKDNNTRKNYTVEIVPGVSVSGIMTCMGVLPVIPDCSLALDTTTTAGSTIHKIAILTESLIYRYYVGSPNVRVFEWNNENEALGSKYMALQFDTVVAKGANYAHTILTKTVVNA
jgi:hypothetical protein